MSNKLPSGIKKVKSSFFKSGYGYQYNGTVYDSVKAATSAKNLAAKLNPSKKNNSMPKVKNYFGDALEKANESSSKSKTTKTKSAAKKTDVKTTTVSNPSYKSKDGKYYLRDPKTKKWYKVNKSDYDMVKNGYGAGLEGTLSKYRPGSTFTGVWKDGKFYENGKLGTDVYHNVFYKNGKPSSGYKDGIYYGNDGKPLNGTINGKIYKKGRFIRNAGGSTSGGNGGTGSSGGGNHSSSSASKAAAAAGSTLSASQYKNYNAHGLLKLVEDKFNQCFNATEFLKKQNAVSEITSALSKINSAINELDSISVSGNNDETYSTSEGRMVPIAISRINAIIDGSSTKVNDYEGHTYSISVTTNLKGLEKNLKQGLKKIAAAYYRKEEEDMVRFISYAKQIYNMVDSKKTSNNGAAIAEIKRKIKDYYLNKAPDRKKKAETHESACRASYESVISYYNGSTN